MSAHMLRVPRLSAMKALVVEPRAVLLDVIRHAAALAEVVAGGLFVLGLALLCRVSRFPACSARNGACSAWTL